VPKAKSPAPKKKENSYIYERLFQEIDRDGSGGISVDELQHSMVSHFKVVLSTTQVERMVAEADLDHNGVIDIDEFKELMKKLKTDSDHSKGVETWVQMTGVSAAYNAVETFNDLSAPLQDIVRRTSPLGIAYMTDDGNGVLVRHASFPIRCCSGLFTLAIAAGLGLATRSVSHYLIVFANSNTTDHLFHPEMVKWVMLAMIWLPGIVLPVHLQYHSQCGLGDVAFGLQVMNSDYQPAGVLTMLIRSLVSIALACTVFGGIADFFYFMISTVGSSLTDWIVGTHVVVHSRGSRRAPEPPSTGDYVGIAFSVAMAIATLFTWAALLTSAAAEYKAGWLRFWVNFSLNLLALL
jgi:hypothetical protein